MMGNEVMTVRIPMSLLLDRMEYLGPEVRLEDPEVWVQGVKLLPGTPEEISVDYLYLCRERDPYPEDSPAIVVIVCRERPRELPRNYILLRTSAPFADIFNELLGLQLLLQEWDLKLSLSVSEGRGVQHLLELSEPVLGNPIVVTDAACRRLFSTVSFDSDDPLFSQWLTQGYLSAENFDILKQSEVYMGEELYSGRTVVLPLSPVKRYVTTFTPVLSADRTCVRYEISMEFCNVPYSDGLFQLYLYLVDKMLVYLRQDDGEQEESQSRYDCFLSDLLDGRCTDRREVEERAQCFLGPDCTGVNVLAVWQADNTDRYRKHALFTLRGLFPQGQPALYGGMLVLLSRLGAPRQGLGAHAARQLQELSEFLESEDAYAGISDPVRSVHELSAAFHRQAARTLELGRKLREGGVERGRIFWYADYRIYQMIDAARETIPAEELVNGLITDLIRYDQAHNTAYRNALCTYLRHERSFTRTAAELHLHRNTVIYQIRRIEELFHIDLDDQELRLQMMLSDRVLEMYPQILQELLLEEAENRNPNDFPI